MAKKSKHGSKDTRRSRRGWDEEPFSDEIWQDESEPQYESAAEREAEILRQQLGDVHQQVVDAFTFDDDEEYDFFENDPEYMGNPTPEPEPYNLPEPDLEPDLEPEPEIIPDTDTIIPDEEYAVEPEEAYSTPVMPAGDAPAGDGPGKDSSRSWWHTDFTEEEPEEEKPDRNIDDEIEEIAAGFNDQETARAVEEAKKTTIIPDEDLPEVFSEDMSAEDLAENFMTAVETMDEEIFFDVNGAEVDAVPESQDSIEQKSLRTQMDPIAARDNMDKINVYITEKGKCRQISKEELIAFIDKNKGEFVKACNEAFADKMPEIQKAVAQRIAEEQKAMTAEREARHKEVAEQRAKEVSKDGPDSKDDKDNGDPGEKTPDEGDKDDKDTGEKDDKSDKDGKKPDDKDDKSHDGKGDGPAGGNAQKVQKEQEAKTKTPEKQPKEKDSVSSIGVGKESFAQKAGRTAANVLHAAAKAVEKSPQSEMEYVMNGFLSDENRSKNMAFHLTDANGKMHAVTLMKGDWGNAIKIDGKNALEYDLRKLIAESPENMFRSQFDSNMNAQSRKSTYRDYGAR